MYSKIIGNSAVVNGKCNGAERGASFDIPCAFLEESEFCQPSCAVCVKLHRRLDSSPIVLSNEITGELKAIPAYAVREYLSKWSPYREVPSHKVKTLFAGK